jgi:hypothetical protein
MPGRSEYIDREGRSYQLSSYEDGWGYGSVGGGDCEARFLTRRPLSAVAGREKAETGGLLDGRKLKREGPSLRSPEEEAREAGGISPSAAACRARRRTGTSSPVARGTARTNAHSLKILSTATTENGCQNLREVLPS